MGQCLHVFMTIPSGRRLSVLLSQRKRVINFWTNLIILLLVIVVLKIVENYLRIH